MARKTIERDFDRNDVGVSRRLLQQMHERVHAFVRIRKQDVLFLDLLHDALAANQIGWPLRACGLVDERFGKLGSDHARKTERISHIERQPDRVNLAALKTETLCKKALGHVGKRALALKTNRSQTAALFEDSLHMTAEILIVFVGFLIHVQVGVARHLDNIGVLDWVHAENLVSHHFERVLEQYEGIALALAVELNRARTIARHGDDAHEDIFRSLSAKGLAALFRHALFRLGKIVQTHRDVKRAVLKMRKRVRRIDDLRRNERQDVRFEILVELIALMGGKLIGIQLMDALSLKLVPHGAEILRNLRCQLTNTCIDRLELFSGGHACLAVVDSLLRKLQVKQAAYAHHEELLQVGSPDGNELHAFEQRHVGVNRLIEHALVERQPRKLSILHVRLSPRAAFLRALHLVRSFKVRFKLGSCGVRSLTNGTGPCFHAINIRHDCPPRRIRNTRKFNSPIIQL